MMTITKEEKERIKSLNNGDILNEWGKLKYGDRYVKCVFPNNQPFSILVYKDENGNEVDEDHSYFRLDDEYIKWLEEHKTEDGRILTDEELINSLKGKSLGAITDDFANARRADGDILKKHINDNRGKMLTVQKLIDYLKTQNPNACIMAYEPNSFGFIEQWPELPNSAIRTVKEDMDSQRDFYLNQWFKDDPNKEKRCEDELAEAYRYCKDDDVIIMF